MKIDEKALEIAIAKAPDWPASRLPYTARSLIQVYEDAKWRPIKELPKDCPFIGPISGGPLYLSIINDKGEEVFCVITDGEGR